MTTSTLLITTGVMPAAASAAVHLSEVGTTLVSGASHWRLGNTDWRTVGILALPGFVGAFAGAGLLSSVDGDIARPWVAILLLALGVYVIYRFLALRGRRPRFAGRLSAWFLAPLGGWWLGSLTLSAVVAGDPWAPPRCSRRDASNHARSWVRWILRSSSSRGQRGLRECTQPSG